MKRLVSLISAATAAAIATQASFALAAVQTCGTYSAYIVQARCDLATYGTGFVGMRGKAGIGADWEYQTNLTKSEGFQVRVAGILLTSDGQRVLQEGTSILCPEAVDATADGQNGSLTFCRVKQSVSKVRIIFSKTG